MLSASNVSPSQYPDELYPNFPDTPYRLHIECDLLSSFKGTYWEELLNKINVSS